MRTFIHFSVFIFFFAFFCSCKKESIYADVIFINGNIYTVDSLKPSASVLAVSNHRIIGLGDNNIIDEFKTIYQNTIFSPEKSEITITHRSSSDLKQVIEQKINRLLSIGVTDVAPKNTKKDLGIDDDDELAQLEVKKVTDGSSETTEPAENPAKPS